MSDLEMVLRRRLEIVKKGVHIGTLELQEAQDAKGLSNEGIGRELHVSEKTWRRWKKIGEIPRYYLGPVAELLSLQIEATLPYVSAPPPDDSVSPDLDARLSTIEATLAEILAELRTQPRVAQRGSRSG